MPGMSEKWAERQIAVRVLIYAFVTHAIAGFIWLLFYLGGHAEH
ncbi:hypothetical protein GCM10010218_41540 [Streptomyces mashuensis]|uniref:Small hydrophobic protein n=1 Tax=Streptomyces mashuensis TaxID=33904 RepID=A0A919B5U7_9ACTN|nr:hypothetical protein GCM10010218_41540 [Streptomyces mashuensis]